MVMLKTLSDKMSLIAKEEHKRHVESFLEFRSEKISNRFVIKVDQEETVETEITSN